MDFDALDRYAELCSSPEPDALHRAWRRSNLHLVGGRMCSGHLQGRLLKLLVQISGARSVVELGTFSGYASVCLAEGLPPDGKLITMECDEELSDFIAQTLSESGVRDRVEVRFGDAVALLADIPNASVDLLFMDADKRQYPLYYNEAKRVVRKGGIILADNTLWDGHVIDPKYDADPQTMAIRDFNQIVARDTDVEQVLLPLRDGLTIIRVK